MPPDSTRSETPPSTVHTRYPLPSAISTLDTVDEYDSFASDSQSESNADDFRTATQGQDRDARNRRGGGRRDSDRLWPRNRSRSPPPSVTVNSPFSPFTPLPPRQSHHQQRRSHQPPLNRAHSPTHGDDNEGLSDQDSFTTIHPIRPQLHPFSPFDTSQSSLATQSEMDMYETASEGGRTRTGVTAMSRSVAMGRGGRGRGGQSPIKTASELSVDTLRPQDARSPGSRSPSVTPRGSPTRLRPESDFIDAPPPIEITPGTPEDDDDDGRSKTPVPGQSADVRSPKARSGKGSEKGKAKGKARQDEPPLSPTTEMRSPKPRSTASRGKEAAAAARAAAAATLSPEQSGKLFPRTNSPSRFDIERSPEPVASPKQSKSKSAGSRSRAAASEKEEAQPLTPQGSRSPVVIRRTSPLLTTQALSMPPSEERSYASSEIHHPAPKSVRRQPKIPDVSKTRVRREPGVTEIQQTPNSKSDRFQLEPDVAFARAVAGFGAWDAEVERGAVRITRPFTSELAGDPSEHLGSADPTDAFGPVVQLQTGVIYRPFHRFRTPTRPFAGHRPTSTAAQGESVFPTPTKSESKGLERRFDLTRTVPTPDSDHVLDKQGYQLRWVVWTRQVCSLGQDHVCYGQHDSIGFSRRPQYVEVVLQEVGFSRCDER
ncbi:hypothetical protein FRC00_012866 [Tulasnella sp. 408]|nr:hypothetical protein FRC00_012866 [Tulasnella sp. 408]